MEVKFLDLPIQVQSLKAEVLEKLSQVLDSCAFTNGPFVEKFENEFAQAHGVKHCIAVNSGTAALHASLMALEIGHGDEVILPANTFFATAEAVSLVGATPIFVDCEESGYNIDFEQMSKAVTDKTKAVMAVHLYGQPADIDRIQQFCQEHQLYLVEDCAQAHLAQYKNQFVGNFGQFGCFSFYPGKNLGAYGEGGAVVTNDDRLAKLVRMVRDHGSEKKYNHQIIGHNFRMSGFQGAVLQTKLKYLANWTQQRQQVAKWYQSELADCEHVQLPQQLDDRTHSFHLFILRTQKREELQAFLRENGIQTGMHYPVPCHKQPAYEQYNDRNLPISENLAGEILSLPMYPELPQEHVSYVASKIKEFYAQ